MSFTSIWQLLGGLGVFLFGMFQMEEAIKFLAGRSFKLFLRKHTENKLKAILSGTIVTVVLKSSSLVILMVLAFVGAGVISFRNAFGVAIGSNLGTTLDNFIVAYVGFKFNVDLIALPFIAIGVLVYLIAGGAKKWQSTAKCFIGFGLMFLGLNLMKVSFQDIFYQFDFAPYIHYPKVVFVFFGFFITAVIQSSSATMVILLSALHAGAFPFEIAATMVIGSELGTSIKIILGALNGAAEKKRLALGNFIFNLLICCIAFVFNDQLVLFIQTVFTLSNPYTALVLFQASINLMGIVLMYPFMNWFCELLEKRFKDEDSYATFYIKRTKPLTSGVGLDVLEKEAEIFIFRILLLNMEAFHLNRTQIEGNELTATINTKNEAFSSYSDRYLDVKKAEGEIIAYYFKLSEENSDHADQVRLNQIMSSIRNAMYSAKGFKDVYEDRMELRSTADNEKYNQYKLFQTQLNDFYDRLLDLLKQKNKQDLFGNLVKIMESAHKEYDHRIGNIYQQGIKNNMSEVDISTLLNVNRELYSSCKAIVFSLKDLLLDEKSASNFENIPISVLK
jgi:phosphate:Na+ symporter